MFEMEAHNLPPRLRYRWLMQLERADFIMTHSVPGWQGGVEYPRDWDYVMLLIPPEVDDYFRFVLGRAPRWN